MLCTGLRNTEPKIQKLSQLTSLGKIFNPLLPSAPEPNFLFQFKKGSQKISYEHWNYESAKEKSIMCYVRKEFRQQRVEGVNNCQKRSSKEEDSFSLSMLTLA